jgi:hypothetical protein
MTLTARISSQTPKVAIILLDVCFSAHVIHTLASDQKDANTFAPPAHGCYE